MPRSCATFAAPAISLTGRQMRERLVSASKSGAVGVSGPDVGIECPDIAVQTLSLVQLPACIASLSVLLGRPTTSCSIR